MARPAERNAKRKLLSVCVFSFRMAKNNRRWSLAPSDRRQPLGARGGFAAETARRLSYRVEEGGAPHRGAVVGAQSSRPRRGREAARAGGVSRKATNNRRGERAEGENRVACGAILDHRERPSPTAGRARRQSRGDSAPFKLLGGGRGRPPLGGSGGSAECPPALWAGSGAGGGSICRIMSVRQATKNRGFAAYRFRRGARCRGGGCADSHPTLCVRGNVSAPEGRAAGRQSAPPDLSSHPQEPRANGIWTFLNIY